MTELEKFRYNLEQKMLPKLYYDSKTDLLNALLDKKGKFFTDLYLIYGPVSDVVYKESDFTVTAKRCMFDEKMLYFVVAELPEPTAVDLCKRIYFCCEVQSEIVRYYTSERQEDGSLVIGSLNKHIVHNTHYGDTSLNMDAEQEFRKVGNMFLHYIKDNSDKR